MILVDNLSGVLQGRTLKCPIGNIRVIPYPQNTSSITRATAFGLSFIAYFFLGKNTHG
jgi:hypothetical protein